VSINHNVFLQRQEPGPKGKVILVSVVDAESVGLKDSEDQVFMMGTTTMSVYSNMNPTITLDNRAKCTAKEFVEIAKKETGQGILSSSPCRPLRDTPGTGSGSGRELYRLPRT